MERPEKTILVDANLLVLLVVGTASRELTAKHKKTKAFTAADYDRLVAMLGDHKIIVLPHIAAEASNLLAFHQEPERQRLMVVLKTFLQVTDEEYVASRRAVSQPEYAFVGLTDAAILSTATTAEILTTDALLHVVALKRGLTAINFNHLR